MRPQKGFTLIELMITLAVLAIVLSLAAPSFRGVMLDNRVSTWSNELLSALSQARVEAIRTGAAVSVIPDPVNGFVAGWRVAAGAVDISVATRSVANDAAVGGNTGVTVTFGRLGNVTAGVPFSLTIRPADCVAGQNRQRVVAVSPAGRPSVTRGVCP